MIHVDFKIRLEDLGKLVWILDAGKIRVYDFSQRVVKQAKPQTNGTVKATIKAGSAVEAIVDGMRTRNLVALTTRGFKDLLVELKLNPVNYQHYLKVLSKAKVLKRTAVGRYKVL